MLNMRLLLAQALKALTRSLAQLFIQIDYTARYSICGTVFLLSHFCYTVHYDGRKG
jgi:hypothetical protein